MHRDNHPFSLTEGFICFCIQAWYRLLPCFASSLSWSHTVFLSCLVPLLTYWSSLLTGFLTTLKWMVRRMNVGRIILLEMDLRSFLFFPS